MGNQGQMVRKYMAMRLKQWRMSQMMHASKGSWLSFVMELEKSQEKFLKCGNFYLTDFGRIDEQKWRTQLG